MSGAVSGCWQSDDRAVGGDAPAARKAARRLVLEIEHARHEPARNWCGHSAHQSSGETRDRVPFGASDPNPILLERGESTDVVPVKMREQHAIDVGGAESDLRE